MLLARPYSARESPRSNSAFWSAKIERNSARDADTRVRLEALEWGVLRFWEYEDPGLSTVVVDGTVARRLSAGAGNCEGELNQVVGEEEASARNHGVDSPG